MLTKEYLLERGFERDMCSPSSVEDFYNKEKSKSCYISVRFKEDKAVGLYAYAENEHTNIRKVVLSDTVVTIEDLQKALEICRLSL